MPSPLSNSTLHPRPSQHPSWHRFTTLSQSAAPTSSTAAPTSPLRHQPLVPTFVIFSDVYRTFPTCAWSFPEPPRWHPRRPPPSRLGRSSRHPVASGTDCHCATYDHRTIFVRTISESSLVELLNCYSDIPLPAANVELLPSVMEVLAPSEKDLNFWNSDFAHLTRIDRSPQNQLWDPKKYVFSESALGGAPTDEDLILF